MAMTANTVTFYAGTALGVVMLSRRMGTAAALSVLTLDRWRKDGPKYR
jgi:hypothetical protein